MNGLIFELTLGGSIPSAAQIMNIDISCVDAAISIVLIVVLADAALGNIDDSLKGNIVVRICNQLNVT